MGAERRCTVRLGRRSAEGQAHLESAEITFLGDGLRLRIPFAEMTRVVEKPGRTLSITFSGGTAVFDLGADAEKWADKIRNPRSVIDKLGIKPGQRIAVLRLRDGAFVSSLRERGAVVATRALKDTDAVFLGAESLADLTGMRRLAESIKRDGAIWTITPKGKGGIKDTDIMEIGKAAGLVATKVVAFSETHSANKFVIPRAAR